MVAADLDLARLSHLTRASRPGRAEKHKIEATRFGIFLAGLVVLIPGCVPEADLHIRKTGKTDEAGETGFPRHLGAVLIPRRAPYPTLAYDKNKSDEGSMPVALMAVAVSEWTPQSSLPVVRLRVLPPSVPLFLRGPIPRFSLVPHRQHTDMRDGGRGRRTSSVYLLYNLLCVCTEGTAASAQQPSESGGI